MYFMAILNFLTLSYKVSEFSDPMCFHHHTYMNTEKSLADFTWWLKRLPPNHPILFPAKFSSYMVAMYITWNPLLRTPLGHAAESV